MRLTTCVDIKSDEKVWEKMKLRMQRESKEVDVGWWGSQHPSGESVATVAMLNEEGHWNGPGAAVPNAYTPPRPFFSVDFRKHVNKVLPEYAKEYEGVISGKITQTAFFAKMRTKLSDALKEIIIDFDDPPNSRTTVSLKKFNDPLIETGTMRDTIKTRVVSSTRK